MDTSALHALLSEWGEPGYRARQAREAQLAGAADWSEVLTLSKSLRHKLEQNLPFWALTPGERAQSEDGTVKWRLVASDGVAVEAVLIPHAKGRATVCVSSQAGCALACTFCATGLLGAGRDLTVSEIVDQAVLAHREAESAGRRLTNVVFMGMGEPLQNLPNVLSACREMADPGLLGLSARRIAISTVGWVPGIAEIAKFDLPVRFALSLHAADDKTRGELMPINARYPIANVLAACRRYSDITGRRVFIEYLLLDGVNDSPGEARRLAGLLRDGNFHVNLIEYNATSGPYRGSTRANRDIFAAVLTEHGLEPSLRRSRGADIAAACGQLALTASAS